MTNRYSLWIMPPGGLYEKLSDLIVQIAGRYHSPVFKPHVTLLGSVPGGRESIVSATSRLASSLKPYDIYLTNAGCLDEYFRCLFIEVERSDEVLRANMAAKRTFANNDDRGYFPHLSLMYGNLSIDVKKEIISDIGEKFDLTFRADSIHLYDTSGAPEEWYSLGEFQLGGRA